MKKLTNLSPTRNSFLAEKLVADNIRPFFVLLKNDQISKIKKGILYFNVSIAQLLTVKIIYYP